MSIKCITPEQFSTFLQNTNAKFSVNIIPYVKTKRGDNGEKSELYVFMSHCINEFITSFNFVTNQKRLLTTLVTTAIRNGSLNAIDLSTDLDLEKRMKIYMFISKDKNDEDVIDLSISPIITVKLDIHTKTEINDIIKNYVEECKLMLKVKNTSQSYNKSLIYMTVSQLFYLSRGTTYPIFDSNGEEYIYNVSDGIFYDKDISDLYRPEEGKRQICKISNNNSTCPFCPIIFNNISPSISEPLYQVMCSEDKHINIFN